MITKEEKIKIFESMISDLRKKFLPSNETKLGVQKLDGLTEKFEKLPLD
jgi:hypothetical protein